MSRRLCRRCLQGASGKAIHPSRGWQVEHNDAGIAQVVERLRDLAPTLVVMEATGGLETVVAVALTTADVRVAVVNPRQVRAFAKATGRLAKSDRSRYWPTLAKPCGLLYGLCPMPIPSASALWSAGVSW